MRKNASARRSSRVAGLGAAIPTVALLLLICCTGCGTATGAWHDLHGTWDDAVQLVNGSARKTLQGRIMVQPGDAGLPSDFAGVTVLFGQVDEGLFDAAQLTDLGLLGNGGQDFALDYLWEGDRQYTIVMTFTSDNQQFSVSKVVGPFDKGNLVLQPQPVVLKLTKGVAPVVPDSNSFSVAPEGTFALTGSVTGIDPPAANVSLTLGGAVQQTTSTNMAGHYGFFGLKPGNYTLTPALSDYSFAPPNQAWMIEMQDITTANFTAMPVPHPTP